MPESKGSRDDIKIEDEVLPQREDIGLPYIYSGNKVMASVAKKLNDPNHYFV